jgi:hypothetical protein
MIDGQSNMLIYNNKLDQTSRPAGSNGYLIKGVEGFNKDIKIYNNIMTKAPYDQETWDFAIELWNTMGGLEIYNNTITSAIDLSGWYGTVKGSYAYSAWIHNNTIGPVVAGGSTGIYLEVHAENVIIERNYIKNVAEGVYSPLYPGDLGSLCSVKNIDIRYNIFNIVGTYMEKYGGFSVGYGVIIGYDQNYLPNTVDNFNVYNNVINARDGTSGTYYGVEIPDVGKATNIRIRNNIIQGFDSYAVYARGGSQISVDYLSIENNIFYNNGNNNPEYSSLASSHATEQNNNIVNPQFVSSSNFNLQSTSPAINSGMNVGLTSDYAGNLIVGLPDIGAYESNY